MFQDYSNISIFPTTTADVIANLVAALLCGIILSLIYRFTYRGPSYSISFVNALVILTIISALVILVIGNNLARAFGLVGAMSIIRFRTAVRDTMDMVYIFLSLAIGMACGIGLNVIALLGVVISGIIIIVMSLTHFGAPRKRMHLLQIAYDSNATPSKEFDKIISEYCRNAKLVNLKRDTRGHLEAYYQVLFKKQNSTIDFTEKLSKIEAVKNVQVFFDENDMNAPTF